MYRLRIGYVERARRCPAPVPALYPPQAALGGKTVLVVSAFDQSIRRQLARGAEAIWGARAPKVTRHRRLRP